MNKAKECFGERDRRMAAFYHQYGLYLFDKIEKNNEVLGGVAQKAVEEVEEEESEEGEDDEKNDEKQSGEEKDENQP